MTSFSHGPFDFETAQTTRLAGIPHRRWRLLYGARELAWHTLPEFASRAEIIEAFADDRHAFVDEAQAQAPAEHIDLIDETTGDVIGGFVSHGVPDMTPGIINDRSRYWLRSSDRLYSRAVDLVQYGVIAAKCSATRTQWIAGLLPPDVLAQDPEAWRPPTAWEIRHVVGEGSFTGLSGARAAALVGVTPQNFRKYTARDGASTRQQMGYAMWHLLLHRLGVQQA